MYLRNFSYSFNTLGIYQPLKSLIEAEKGFLVNLFEIKEKTEAKLNDFESNGLKLKNNELFENLKANEEGLFKEFLLRYCTSRKLLSFRNDDNDILADKYNELDNIVRFNIGRSIFFSTSKENILKFVDHPLELDYVVEIIGKFIDGFLGEFKNYLSRHYLDSAYSNHFFGYYYDVIFNDIMNSLKSTDSVDLEKMLDIITETLLSSFDENDLKISYFDFLDTKPYLSELGNFDVVQKFGLDECNFGPFILSKRFSDSLEYLGTSDVFSDLIKNEENYLSNLFEIGEDVDEELNHLKAHWVRGGIESHNNLVVDRQFLFSEFFLRYCTNRRLLDFIFDENDELTNKFVRLDKIVRFNISRKIFLGSKSENIVEIVKNPLNVEYSQEVLKDFVYSFLGDFKKFLENELNNDISLDEFFGYYTDVVLNNIFDSLYEKPESVNLEKMLGIVAEILFMAVDEDELKASYFEFKKQESGWHNELQMRTGLNKDNSLSQNVSLGVDRLISGTYFDDPAIFELSSEELGVDGAEIANQTWIFIDTYLNKNDEFKVSDENNFRDMILSVHLDDKHYSIWKKMFIEKVKLPISVDDIKFAKITDCENIQNFILKLKNKYPKAKSYIGNIGVQGWKSLKNEFIISYKEKFLGKLENVLDDRLFKNMSLVQLYTIMYYYLAVVVGHRNLSILPDFEKYVEKILESKFKESHDKTVEKEKQKENQKHSSLLQTEKKESESKMGKPSTKSGESGNSTVAVKIELPEKMIEQLKEYFSTVDLDRDLVRSLKKSGGFYKTGWFSRFGVDEKFFEILNENGFICVDESVDYADNSVDVNDDADKSQENPCDVVVESDDEFSKLRKLIEKIGNIDDIDEKVDYYIQAFELFYDFKDVETFKTQILNSIKYDIRVLKGVDLVLYKILNGQKEEIKTSGMTKRKRYFRFDLGYNTGYRIVIQDQDGSNRRIIVDFVDHDTYSNNISSYLKAF